MNLARKSQIETNALYLKFQIEIYQWLGPIIALFFIYRIISQFRANRRLLLGTIIWVSFWMVIILLSVIPGQFSISLAQSLGFKNNINAVIFVALGFLFIMTYNQSATIERLEKQITTLVRKVALEKQENLNLQKKLNTQGMSNRSKKKKAKSVTSE